MSRVKKPSEVPHLVNPGNLTVQELDAIMGSSAALPTYRWYKSILCGVNAAGNVSAKEELPA